MIYHAMFNDQKTSLRLTVKAISVFVAQQAEIAGLPERRFNECKHRENIHAHPTHRPFCLSLSSANTFVRPRKDYPTHT